MATLKELREKYKLSEGAKHEPKPDCKFCKGTGEKKRKNGELAFCICLFVDHAASDEIGESLSQFAKKELAKLKSQPKGGG